MIATADCVTRRDCRPIGSPPAHYCPLAPFRRGLDLSDARLHTDAVASAHLLAVRDYFHVVQVAAGQSHHLDAEIVCVCVCEYGRDHVHIAPISSHTCGAVSQILSEIHWDVPYRGCCYLHERPPSSLISPITLPQVFMPLLIALLCTSAPRNHQPAPSCLPPTTPTAELSVAVSHPSPATCPKRHFGVQRSPHHHPRALPTALCPPDTVISWTYKRQSFVVKLLREQAAAARIEQLNAEKQRLDFERQINESLLRRHQVALAAHAQCPLLCARTHRSHSQYTPTHGDTDGPERSWQIPHRRSLVRRVGCGRVGCG